MTETTATAGAADAPATAGALLRVAREKQGLHIAALAAAIKVAPRKLDALEHDRYDELPDATFTRALAQTVCRTLKIDAQPVLALLPSAEPVQLDTVAGSLNAPFRERPMRDEGAGMAAAAIRPMTWAGLVLLVAAAAVYFVPGSTWQRLVAPDSPAPGAVQAPVAMPAAAPASAGVGASPATADAAAGLTLAGTAAAAAAASAAAPVVETVHSAPPADAAAAPAIVQRLVMLRSSDASWVEARDVRGQVLFSRVVQPGEAVGFDGALPIRLTIGNAPVTQLSFRGKAVDLVPSTRENVARIELQ